MRLVIVLPVLVACGRFGFDTEDHADAESPIVEPCDPRIDATTVALYSFETSLTADTTKQHDASIIGGVAATPAPCSTGASIADGNYLLVPASPAFDLSEGSVELFARVVNPRAGYQALLARDAGNQDFNGHLTIGFAPSGQLFVRMQRIDRSVLRCTAPTFPAEQWVHIGVSFGPPGFQLWVDGVAANGGTAFVYDKTYDCAEPHAFGIDGNDNTLVIGGNNNQSANGTPTPTIIEPLTGAVDQIRIRSTWRDFGN